MPLTVHEILRHAALAIPRVRRFYEHAACLRSERDQLAARMNDLQKTSVELQGTLAHTQEANNQLRRECDELAENVTVIKSNYRRLQSDYERSLAHTEELRMRLKASELRREQVEWLAENQARLRERAERLADSETQRRLELEPKTANSPAKSMAGARLEVPGTSTIVT